MRKGWILILALLFAVSLGACMEDGVEGNWVTWPLGLQVVGKGQEVEVTKVYKQIKGGDAVPQKGTIDSGALVGASSGTVTVTETNTYGNVFKLVGEMERSSYVPGLEVCNPCCEGDELQDVKVFVAEGASIWRGKTVTDESYIELRNGGRFEYRTQDTAYTDRETNAYTFGFAGEDYIVRVDDLGGIYGDLSQSVFLTRRDADVGDFWVSPNGEITYSVIDKGGLQVGEKNGTAIVVELRSAANVADMNIAGSCLTEYSDRNTQNVETGQSPAGFYYDVVSTSLHLDPGCEGSFVHRKIGTEYWMDNVLVKEEAVYYEVTILDYGYEWQEISGDSRFRRTSKVLTSQVPSSADIFVQFSVTERTVTWEAVEWNEIKLSEDEGDVWPADPTSYLDDDDKISGGTRPGDMPADGDVPDGDAPEDGDVPFDGDVPDGDTPDGDTPDGDTPDGDTPDGDTPDGDVVDKSVGAGCVDNTDCDTGMCMDEAAFQSMTGDDYALDGGYCTALDETTCTANGGTPIYLGYGGEGYSDAIFCAKACADDTDCRADDYNYCWDPVQLSEYEHLSEAEVETYFGSDSYCLPYDVLNWLLDLAYDA